jgi:hypothetical protein
MKKHMLAGMAVFFIITGIVLAACKRDYTWAAEYYTPNGTAYLRIVHAAPGFGAIYSVPDSFNVLLNGTKVTGFVPGGAPLMTYGTIFPTVSSANGYITVPAGTQEFKLSMGALNPDSVTIKRFTKVLVSNAYYSLVITDSINSDKDAAQIFVRDTINKPTVGYFNLRFIHAVWNDTTGKTVDIWSTRNNRYLFNNIKPGTVTTFTTFGYNSQLNDTLFVRRSGTGYTLATFNNVPFSNQRTYTLYYKGDGTLTTGVRARGLATYVHQ